MSARFRVLDDPATVLMWGSGSDSRCNYFNEAWLRFTGRTLEQELGDGWSEGVHPQDRGPCLSTYHRAFEARCPFQMEYRLRGADGKYHWIRDFGVPRFTAEGAFDGYAGSCIETASEPGETFALEGDEWEGDTSAGETNARKTSRARMQSVLAEPDDLSCPEPGALNGLSVLVVDNHADTQELVRVLLENCGARVLTTGTAQEALEAIETDPPDLVLTEIELPRQDGFELLRDLRALPGDHAEIPAIAFTTHARERDRNRSLRAGFRKHIVKPVEPSALVEAIVDVTRRGPEPSSEPRPRLGLPERRGAPTSRTAAKRRSPERP